MPKDAKIEELTNSRSQILEYLNCGYRWDLGYRRGIASTSVREGLDLGSATHLAFKYGIQAYVLDPKKWSEATAKKATMRGAFEWAEGEKKARGAYLTGEHKEQLMALQDEAIAIATRALMHFDLPSWEVAMWKGKPLVEVELIVPLRPWKGYRTIPDLVARRRSDGKKAPFWLIDWKTRGQMESDDAEEVNLQFATMQLVIEHNIKDISIEGSILWQIRSEAPKWPKTNKDGTISRALLATDWATYCKALAEAGQNPADYQEMKEKLATIEWYRSIVQHRTSAECTRIWREIVVPAARRMAQDPQVIRRWVHQPFACKGCWARAFCMAELRGDDTEFLLETDYMDTRAPRKAREMGERRRQFELT